MKTDRINFLNAKFKEVYTPISRCFSIDETIVPFKGRCFFLQYMPAKPTAWDIKIWNLCESGTSYMYNFQVYRPTGKKHNQAKGLLIKVVVDLCACLLQNWYN